MKIQYLPIWQRMKRLVYEMMLGADMQDGLAFLGEIEDHIRR